MPFKRQHSVEVNCLFAAAVLLGMLAVDKHEEMFGGMGRDAEHNDWYMKHLSCLIAGIMFAPSTGMAPHEFEGKLGQYIGDFLSPAISTHAASNEDVLRNALVKALRLLEERKQRKLKGGEIPFSDERFGDLGQVVHDKVWHTVMSRTSRPDRIKALVGIGQAAG